MKKRLVGGLIAVALVLGAIWGVSAWRGQTKDDVFTDALFENMASIQPLTIPAAAREGEAAEPVISYLKSLRLEPTEETIPPRETDEITYGRPAGSYQINYQDNTTKLFVVSESLLEIDGKNYRVVDKAGNAVADIDETLWRFFYPNSTSQRPVAQVDMENLYWGYSYMVSMFASSDSVADMDTLSAELPDRFPVYVNDYASWQEGPLYAMTDELREAATGRIEDYLRLLYPDRETFEIGPPLGEDWNTTKEYDIVYTDDSVDLRGGVNGFAVSLEEYDLPDDVTDEALLSEPVVKAAVEYLGIQAPTVTRLVSYNFDGTVSQRTYRIVEGAQAGNPVFRARSHSFSDITVDDFSSGMRVSVSTVGMNGGPKEYPLYHQVSEPGEIALPYATVWDLLKTFAAEGSYETYCEELGSTVRGDVGFEQEEERTRILKADEAEVRAEICYNSVRRPGYFVPCYRFYVWDEEKEGYGITEVRIMDRMSLTYTSPDYRCPDCGAFLYY